MPSELTEEEEALDGAIKCGGCEEAYLKVVIRQHLSVMRGEQYKRALVCPNCGTEESLDDRL